MFAFFIFAIQFSQLSAAKMPAMMARSFSLLADPILPVGKLGIGDEVGSFQHIRHQAAI